MSCPFVKRQQIPCNLRLRKGFEFCAKHSKIMASRNRPVILAPSTKKIAPSISKTVEQKNADISKIIDEALLNQFYGDEKSESESDEVQGANIEPVKTIEPPQPTKQPEPIKNEIQKPGLIKKEIERPVSEPIPIPKKKKNYIEMGEDELAELLDQYVSSKDKKAIDVLKALKAKNIIDSNEYKQLFSSLM